MVWGAFAESGWGDDHIRGWDFNIAPLSCCTRPHYTARFPMAEPGDARRAPHGPPGGADSDSDDESETLTGEDTSVRESKNSPHAFREGTRLV